MIDTHTGEGRKREKPASSAESALSPCGRLPKLPSARTIGHEGRRVDLVHPLDLGVDREHLREVGRRLALLRAHQGLAAQRRLADGVGRGRGRGRGVLVDVVEEHPRVARGGEERGRELLPVQAAAAAGAEVRVLLPLEVLEVPGDVLRLLVDPRARAPARRAAAAALPPAEAEALEAVLALVVGEVLLAHRVRVRAHGRQRQRRRRRLEVVRGGGGGKNRRGRA
mmetsp:Transcript_7542/g.18339  ORF Transcript_7542/g.18339 Transcript_7542/m.18339 type:complete len:225 (-) Transcript_7542:34-708(-)